MKRPVGCGVSSTTAATLGADERARLPPALHYGSADRLGGQQVQCVPGATDAGRGRGAPRHRLHPVSGHPGFRPRAVGCAVRGTTGVLFGARRRGLGPGPQWLADRGEVRGQGARPQRSRPSHSCTPGHRCGIGGTQSPAVLGAHQLQPALESDARRTAHRTVDHIGRSPRCGY